MFVTQRAASWGGSPRAPGDPGVRLALLPPSRAGDAAIIGGTLIRDKCFVPGEQVALGGGGYSGPADALDWVQPPDPSCNTAAMWISVSVDDL